MIKCLFNTSVFVVPYMNQSKGGYHGDYVTNPSTSAHVFKYWENGKNKKYVVFAGWTDAD